MPSDLTNDTFATATLLTGINNAPQGKVEQILNTDNKLDFYRFTVSGSSNLRINLTGINGDVQLSLYRSPSATATPTETDKITLRASSSGRVAESYTSTSDPALSDLAAGTYYIKVEQQGVPLPSSTYSLSVLASTSQDTISALWRNPAGGLDIWQMAGNAIDAKGPFIPVDTPATLKLVGTGDFDADGIDDILWKDTVQNTFTLWFMENGTVRKGVGIIQDNTGLQLRRTNDWAIVGIDDIDKDGFTDLLLRNQTSGEIDAWFMNGSDMIKGVNLANGFRIYADWQIAGFSNSRILWRNINSNAVATWHLDQNGIKSAIFFDISVPQDWQVNAYQDFNNDGTPDILWRNLQSQLIGLWRMGPTSTQPLEAKVYSVPNQYRISAIADFNGDKRPDIFFWDGLGGTIALWEIQQDVVNVNPLLVKSESDTGPILNLKDLNNEFEALLARDFDGDGKADILWRNKNTGLTAFWQMNGSVLKKFGELELVPVTSSLPTIAYYGHTVGNSLKASTKKVPQFTAGLNQLNAFDLGVLDGAGSFLDSIGGPTNADRVDWYKFRVEIPSQLTGLNVVNTLGNPTVDAPKLELFTERGSRSNVAFTPAELLEILNPEISSSGVMTPKTYWIKVTPNATKLAARTPYTFNITGRLGLTNLKANEFEIDKTSIVLDTNSANNKINVTKLVIENNGDFPANNVSIDYYLSRDGVWDASDRRLTTDKTVLGTVARGIAEKVNPDGSITPGTPFKYTVPMSPTITLTLPGANDSFWSTSGVTYRIIAVIDPGQKITNEKKIDDNAIASLPFTVVGVGGMDLTGNGFTSSTSVSKTGTITGTFSIKNIGGVALPSNSGLKVRFYFSTDRTIGSQDDLELWPTTTTNAITITSAITAGGSLPTQQFTFNLADSPDAANYWVDYKPAGSTQLAGFIGMVIDTTSVSVTDVNVRNNLNQALAIDTANLTITGL